MPFERLTIIIENVGLGEAAKRNVGTGENQIP
ncbi:phage tail protein, partial [Escherichia coli]